MRTPTSRRPVKTLSINDESMRKKHAAGLAGDPQKLVIPGDFGRSVQLSLFSATADHVDIPAANMKVTDEFRALPPISTLCKFADTSHPLSGSIYLRAWWTKLGNLELCFLANAGEGKRRLEFELRDITAGTVAQFFESRVVVRLMDRKQTPPLDATNLSLVELGKKFSARARNGDGRCSENCVGDLEAGAKHRR